MLELALPLRLVLRPRKSHHQNWTRPGGILRSIYIMRSCLEAGHAGNLPRALHLEVNDGGAKTRVAMIATYRCKGSEPSRGVSTPLVSLAITCVSSRCIVRLSVRLRQIVSSSVVLLISTKPLMFHCHRENTEISPYISLPAYKFLARTRHSVYRGPGGPR